MGIEGHFMDFALYVLSDPDPWMDPSQPPDDPPYVNKISLPLKRPLWNVNTSIIYSRMENAPNLYLCLMICP